MSRGNLKARRPVFEQVSNSRLPGPSPGVGLGKPLSKDTTMQSKTSRRAVLAGIVAPALAASTLTLAGATVASHQASSAGPDPIFAAIEQHKVAFRISQELGRVRSGTVDCERDPEYDAVQCKAAIEADSAATDASNEAAYALTTVRPTTMAGALALLRYVEAFNAGAFFLEPLPGSTVSDWQSGPFFWPEDKDEHDIDLFGYRFLANVRSALEAMAAVS